MEVAVRKATRLEYIPPKQKHLQTLINSTFQSPGNSVLIIDLLEKRLRENSWIVTFKVLIIIHTLMRLGDEDKIISYVETRPSALDTSKLREKSSGVVHIQNIYNYTAYLEQKVVAYRNSKIDYVKDTMGKKKSRLRHLSVADGLLKETIILQKQTGALLKCNFMLESADNDLTLYAFRLLIDDLLVLFQVINESIANILEHYFAMNKADARTSLDIYKRFAKQTEDIIAFLERARQLQHELNISIPTVKHAPLSLAAALQGYLDDANDTPQEQNSTSVPTQNQLQSSVLQQQQQQQQPQQSLQQQAFQPQQQSPQSQEQQQQPKELIDFFASLQNETVNIFYNPAQNPVQTMQPPVLMLQQQQQTGGHNPFRTNTNDMGMSLVTTQNTSNVSNPFRASTMPPFSTSAPSYNQQPPSLFTQQLTNVQPMSSLSSPSNNPFASQQVVLASSPTKMMESLNNNINNNNPFTNMAQKQQQQTMWTGGGGNGIF